LINIRAVDKYNAVKDNDKRMRSSDLRLEEQLNPPKTNDDDDKDYEDDDDDDDDDDGDDDDDDE
jgi:hypothetical protein